MSDRAAANDEKQAAAVRPDVLFVIPPVLRFLGKSSAYFPLGLGYMVSYLERAGLRAEIYNADVGERSRFTLPEAGPVALFKRLVLRRNTFNVDFARSWPAYHARVQNEQDRIWREVAAALASLRLKIIGIFSKVVDIPSTFILAGIVRKVLPGTPVVVGGPSAVTCGEYLMNNPAIDYLVLGEGEETVVELTRALVSGGMHPQITAIRGVGYRGPTGELVANAPRPLIEDLDTIPFPDRQALFAVDRTGKRNRLREYRDILTSRGCPYRCTFCCAYQAWGTRKPRFRSIGNIADELEFLRNEYGQRDFIFWDDLFTADRERVVAICGEIIKRKLDVTWLCLSRINTIDEALLRLMKEAGCREIQIGVESGNDRILKFIRKGITRTMLFERLPLLKRAGIPLRIFLIIGFPTETREEMDDTLRLIDEIRPDYVDLSLFCPYPGTELHRSLQERGQLGADFMKSDMWYPYHNYTGIMSDADFQTYAFKALQRVDDYTGSRP